MWWHSSFILKVLGVIDPSRCIIGNWLLANAGLLKEVIEMS
jgi:hypothetical protein